MDLGVAQTLAATTGTDDLAGLKKIGAENNPAATRKVAQQFGALLMENLMRQADGTALPMVEGTGSDVVNQMFVGTISRSVTSNEKMGLTDLLLRGLQKTQQQADSGSIAAMSSAKPKTTSTGTSFSLAGYWAANGMRPLAAAVAQGAVSPGTGTTLALMTHINPKLATAFGAGAYSGNAGDTNFQSAPGHASGGASAEERAAFSQKLMPLLQKAGQQLGVGGEGPE